MKTFTYNGTGENLTGNMRSGPLGHGNAFPRFPESTVIPGFGLTFGLTLTWLAVIVLIPISALLLKASSISAQEFLNILLAPRTLNALKLSFGLSFVAAIINVFFGLIVAWALTRYEFPGRRLADAIVDIPFALPTAVAGIALASL
ncbi:MAG TPA: hypothetical protein VNR65_02140, partial [Geobacterales bacterium]|nr:hypothetical protein [Geobacterales bacterium]